MGERQGNVLLLVSSLGFGGAEKHIVTLANRLDTVGFRVALCYLKPIEGLLSQLEVAHLTALSCLQVRRRLDWTAIRTLTELIDRSDIDVVVCANTYPALYAWLAGRRARRPPKLVEIFHTTTCHGIKEKLQMLLYRRIFRRFDALVYVSSNQRAYWAARGLGARRDLVIHNGIDTDLFRDRDSREEKLAQRARFGFGPQDFVVGICAALRPEKAHGDLLHAIGQLRGRGATQARALLIGDGPERRRIEALIRSLGLTGSAVITGFQQDVRPFVACCDVMVLTSHAVETLSIAALEAMALGKPLVLSRIGGAEELVTDGVNGLLFEAGDVGLLTQHLASLTQPEIRGRMTREALRRATEWFSEARMIAAYEALLSELPHHPVSAKHTPTLVSYRETRN